MSNPNKVLDALLRAYHDDDDGSDDMKSPQQEERKGRQAIKRKAENLNDSSNSDVHLWHQKHLKNLEIKFDNSEVLNELQISIDLELFRRKLVRQLHLSLENLALSELGADICFRLPLHTSVTLRNGDALFEKWLFAAIDIPKTNSDPLIPSSKGLQAGQKQLMEDLKEHCAVQLKHRAKKEQSKQRITNIVEEIVDRFTDQATRIVNSTIPPLSRKKRSIKWDFATETLSYKNTKLKLNHNHYSKLRRLFIEHVPYVVGKKNEIFLTALFRMILRYDTLGGPGFQASLPSAVFQILKDTLNVECEVFASPLNCNYSYFCSLFPDTDVPFGSIGSFFDFYPNSGSFEANPPFVPAVIVRMAKHINYLLINSQLNGKKLKSTEGECSVLIYSPICQLLTLSTGKGKGSRNKSSLSFTIIVPSKFDEHIHQHISNEFFVHKLLLDNRSHYYTMGAQQKQSVHGHRSSSNEKEKKRLMKSTCDTSVYIFQNENARTCWPLNGDFDKLILEAFTTCNRG